MRYASWIEKAYFAVNQFSFNTCLILGLGILILCWCHGKSQGMVTLSPMSVAPVCDVGDPLQLTCTASVEFIRWNITVVNDQGITEEITVNINSGDTSQQMSQRIINSTIFTFMRTSTRFASPLVSTLSIDSVSIDLNGTVIRCMEVGGSMASASTTIQIRNNQYTPIIRVISEVYGAENVTVVLEWTQLVEVVYNVSVMPLAPLTCAGNTSCQLTLLYDTDYNFNVVATTPCRNFTAVLELNFDFCSYPTLAPSVNNDSIPQVVGYNDLPVRVYVPGTNITFSCPPGLVLVGPNVATCFENGEWEPDLTGLMCHHFKVNCGQPPSPGNSHIIPYFSTLEGAAVTYVCSNTCQKENTKSSLCTEINTTAVCNNNGVWELDSQDRCSVFSVSGSEGLNRDGKIAVASSVTVFAVASILFFIIGFLCGHFCQKRRKSSTTAAASETVPPGGSGGQTQTPYYDDVVIQQSDQELELKENVAYGPIRSTISA